MNFNISSSISSVTTTISETSSKVIKQINQIDFVNPNVLIDIYIKFIIIASCFYIIYKYYIIDMTIDNIYKFIFSKFEIYKPTLKNIRDKNKIIFDSITNFMINYSNKLKNLENTKNSKVNDTNIIIIFVTMIISLFIIIAGIIYITNGYNNINFINIGYSIIFNLIFIVLSQFILFYSIYSLIDPVKLYKFFYYNYDINPINNNLESKKLDVQDKTTESIIINSNKTGIIYIFTILFICIFIFTLLLSIINYLIIYKNYKINNSIIPFNKLSFIIYIIISFFSLIILIILLILLLNII